MTTSAVRCATLAAVLLALAAACRDPSAPCQDNGECRENELCVLERCHTVCTSNQQCARTDVCRDGICWPEEPHPASDAAARDSAAADRRSDSALVPDTSVADSARDAASGDRRDASAAEAAVDAARPDSAIADAAVADATVAEAAVADTGGADAGQCTDFALSFDGVDDYFEVPDSADLDGLDAFTVEAWIFPATTATGSTRMRFISHHSAGAPPYTGFGLSIYYGPWSFFLGHGANYNSASSNLAAEWPQASQWYHVAGSFDGTLARLFVNGRLLASAASAGAPSDCTLPLTIGMGAYDHAYPFAGLISEVRISGVARYTADFTPPAVKFSADADTIVLWHLDEGSGQAVADSSDQGRHAVIGASSDVDDADPAWVTTACIGDRF